MGLQARPYDYEHLYESSDLQYLPIYFEGGSTFVKLGVGPTVNPSFV